MGNVLSHINARKIIRQTPINPNKPRMKRSEFDADLDSFIDGLSSILVFFLGEQANQKLDAQKPLLHLVITPGTIINIVHPLIIFMSVTLFPHNFSIWIQITIYLSFLLLFIKWCKYVTRLKTGLRKANN